MADVKMPPHVPCQFDLGLDGKCGRPSDNERCGMHEDLACVSCGAQAQRRCTHYDFHKQCQEPLCGNCQHGKDGKHFMPDAVAAVLPSTSEPAFAASTP